MSSRLLLVLGVIPASEQGQPKGTTVSADDGCRLWTAETGHGTPLIMCHGGPGLWDYLAPLAALLDDTFTVVRFDQRGCGRSTGHDGPFTIKQAVDGCMPRGLSEPSTQTSIVHQPHDGG